VSNYFVGINSREITSWYFFVQLIHGIVSDYAIYFSTCKAHTILEFNYRLSGF